MIEDPIRWTIGATHHLIVLVILFCVCLLLFGATTGQAEVTDAECAKIRSLNASSGDLLFFQKGQSFYSFLKNQSDLAGLVQNNSNNYVRFVYLVKFDGDSQPPMFSVIQRFLLTDSYGYVKTYNNIRRHPLSILFDEYQKFYHDGDNPINHQDLMEWFNLGPGFFTHRDFVDTSRWPEPREFLAIPGTLESGEEIRSYLIAMVGIRDDGSCFDFTPYVSRSTHRLSFIIRDLRATPTGDYRDPFDATVEFPQ